MKYIIAGFFFILPFHAFLITFLKCKLGLNTDIFRFYKEIILLLLFFYTIFYVLKRYKYKISKIYENNYLLGTITAFAIVSLFFIVLPFPILELFDKLGKNSDLSSFEVIKEFLKTDRVKAGFLGYKYDVFFLLAIVIGYYLPIFRKNFKLYLRSTISAILVILAVFIPVYLFSDIASFYQFFGYTTDVSTYNPNSCLTYSQNVEGGHNRFQATFGGPIRFSVFLTVFYFLYLGAVLSSKRFLEDNKKYLIIFFTTLYLIALYNSYTKTAFLGFLVGLSVFAFFTYKEVFKKTITKKFLLISSIFISIPLFLILYIKRDLFLHLGAIVNRLENLRISTMMFFDNPFGHGLGIAGPASQLGTMINYSAPEQSIYFSGLKVYKFLPENWYVQILLEQGILGLGLFIGILSILGVYLYRILKRKKDFMSIGFFSAFIALVFMANFTHAFEESATSYLFFLLLGAYIGENLKRDKTKKV